MGKHTQEKWFIDPATDGRSRGFIRCERGVTETNRGIAICRVNETGIGYSEAQANAKLIAAAPTMYEYIEARAAYGDSEAKAILENINARS
jgi:hypothetical protein